MGRGDRDKVIPKTLLPAWQHTIGRDLMSQTRSLRSEEFVFYTGYHNSGDLHKTEETFPKITGFGNQWGIGYPVSCGKQRFYF